MNKDTKIGQHNSKEKKKLNKNNQYVNNMT